MKPRITIVSLGPGDPDLLNQKTISAMKNAAMLVLRTAQHPIAEWLVQNQIPFISLDTLYAESVDFDTLNQSAVSHLIHFSSDQPIVYAVPDASSDHTVRALFSRETECSPLEVIPGVGSFDACMSSSLPFLTDTPVTIVSASDFLDFSCYDPKYTLLITELDNPILAGNIKIKLSESLEDEHKILLFSANHAPFVIPLFMLDRQHCIDHRSALLITGSGFRARNQYVMQDLVEIMDYLRSPSGCSWDRTQTHESLRPYLLEEAWECVAAIEENDMDHLCDELGDLLFQIVFHASIGKNFDEFTLNDVINNICGKMIRRHPHVFSETLPDSVKPSWEELKQQETGHISVKDSLDDVSTGLPSLKYAAKILKKLNQTDLSSRTADEIISDIRLTIEKLHSEQDKSNRFLGIILMLVSELCCNMKVDSEMVLHETTDRLKELLKNTGNGVNNNVKSFKHLTFSELGVYLQYVEGEIE